MHRKLTRSGWDCSGWMELTPNHSTGLMTRSQRSETGLQENRIIAQKATVFRCTLAAITTNLRHTLLVIGMITYVIIQTSPVPLSASGCSSCHNNLKGQGHGFFYRLVYFFDQLVVAIILCNCVACKLVPLTKK